MSEAGLHLNPKYPFLGASPDGLVCCDCCGTGVLEIKCPFCLTKKSIHEAAEDKSFCLVNNEKGQLQLNKDHQYYYQVQLQLLLTGASYCDFMVWREDSEANGEIFLERLQPDMTFVEEGVAKAKLFFLQGVLPELVGKWYSRTHSQPLDGTTADRDGPCYCRNEAVPSSLFECKSGFCKIGLFHQTCLGLKNVPKRKWLCPDCRTVEKATKLKHDK